MLYLNKIISVIKVSLDESKRIMKEHNTVAISNDSSHRALVSFVQAPKRAKSSLDVENTNPILDDRLYFYILLTY